LRALPRICVLPGRQHAPAEPRLLGAPKHVAPSGRRLLPAPCHRALPGLAGGSRSFQQLPLRPRVHWCRLRWLCKRLFLLGGRVRFLPFLRAASRGSIQSPPCVRLFPPGTRGFPPFFCAQGAHAENRALAALLLARGKFDCRGHFPCLGVGRHSNPLCDLFADFGGRLRSKRACGRLFWCLRSPVSRHNAATRVYP